MESSERANMSDVEKLHNQIKQMSLGDLCLVVGEAINLRMDEKRVDILLKYLERKIALRSIYKAKEKDESK